MSHLIPHFIKTLCNVINSHINTRRVVLLDIIEYSIDDKEMITDIPVTSGSNVAAAHGGVNLVIDVIIDHLVKDGSDLDNIEDSSIIV